MKRNINFLLFLFTFIFLELINSCMLGACKVVELPKSEKDLVKKFKLNQKFVFLIFF